MCDSVANIDHIILSPDVLPGIKLFFEPEWDLSQ